MSAFVSPLQCVEATGAEGRQGTAVNSCGTFLSKKQPAQLWAQSLLKPNIFSVSGPFEALFKKKFIAL